ncbi:MAG: adenylate/guanylate cyclase domain-containing protein, partial [Saprospiraceae bacterium]|nr:adenylate/guanylate cyclase domain-containing protein [Saprospiraceae bacterium]
IARNVRAPGTAITSVTAADEPVTYVQRPLTQRAFRKAISLPFRRNDLLITYTGLHLKEPAQNQFAYQLAGWDNDWIAAGAQRTASYSNLDPGRYTFRVKAANSDGVWLPDDRAVELPIEIRPPWWATWWAYTLYGLIIVGSLWGWYRWRTREQRRKLEQQTRLNKASARFVPKAFLSAIGRQNILEVQLGDLVEREVTVLFSDIRDFTSISESMSPEENFKFVNTYAGKMGPVIQRYHGFVNQYLGDGIMAIFPERPADALQAAIEMQRAVQQLNKEQASADHPLIATGMGLHTGPLIMGILGDRERLDAATISDTVNTAARIESLTKYYRVTTLLSASTLAGLNKDAYHIRYLGKVQVKGKEIPVDVYDCFDADLPAQIAFKQATRGVFETAVGHFLAGDFDSAGTFFNEVIATNPDDQAAIRFLRRTRRLAHEGVPEGWSGVERLGPHEQ